MAVMEFRYRPGVFSAVEFDGTNGAEVVRLIGPDAVVADGSGLVVRVPSGEKVAVPAGWWVGLMDGEPFVSSAGMRSAAWLPA